MPLVKPQTKQTALSLLYLLFASFAASAQPYIDIGKLGYYYTPARSKHPQIGSQVYSLNVTLPFELKKGGDAIVINPFFDQNQATARSKDVQVRSAGMLAGFLKKGIVSRWDVMTSIVVRKNSQIGADVRNDWQAGGLVLAIFRQNESRSLKVGLYYNREFFGNFFMPLLGIDWKWNDNNSLFGILPGSMTLEHKFSPRFYAGASFRALTNSYRLNTVEPCSSGDCSAKNYLRINDNQLGLFADVYLSKRIVFSTEGGHTIMRKYRFGFKGSKLHTYNDLSTDNWYMRGTIAYRIRLRS